MIATGPIKAATGIAIISAVPTLIAPAGARGRAGSVRGALQKPAVAGGHGMLVMFGITALPRLHTMTIKDATRGTADLKALVASDPDFVRGAETVGAARGERSATRLGYRAGYYGRTLVTRGLLGTQGGDLINALAGNDRILADPILSDALGGDDFLL